MITTEVDQLDGFRSGFVALVGRPNVGKSTLINQFVGQKVAIVSDKPQTTRNRVQAVLTLPKAQIVFLDTPGIHKPRHRLGERMVRAAQQAWKEVDAVAFLIDGAAGVGPGDRFIAADLARIKTPVVLVVNKIDEAEGTGDEIVARCVAELNKGVGENSHKLRFESTWAISALKGDGVEALRDSLVALLPEGPKYYPDDWVTDHPERFIIGELVREKILHHTRDEVPHAIAVYVERIAPRESQDIVDVDATIYVERDSQRGIIIGKGGAMLKRVGTEARAEIEALLGSSINLQLWVKVKKDWRNVEGSLQEFGYRD